MDNSVNNDLAIILDELVIFSTKKRYQEVGEVLGDLGVSANPQKVTQIQPSMPVISVAATPPQKVTQIQQSTPVIAFPATPRIQVSSSPQVLIGNLPGGIKLELVKIPAGSFMMGSNERDSEKPTHKVILKEFYLGKYPVTQEQYQAVMGSNPSNFKAGFLKQKSNRNILLNKLAGMMLKNFVEN